MVYYLEIGYGDGCNYWRDDVLHTKNKKQLDDLCTRLGKMHKGHNFRVRQLNIATHSLTSQDIKEALRYQGVEL